MIRLGAAFALAAPLAGFGAALTGGTARADSSCGVFLAEGDVVALSGTPHVWVADKRGGLHWGGDTRALADRVLNWRQRRDVTAAQLRALPVGDPWLSAGLLKIGDPIYLVKWESDAPAPTLLHVQSIADLELFGIDSRNYGAMVVEPAEWERRYGIATATLPRAELSAAAAPASEGYDADWSCGAAGWMGSSGWAAGSGTMANDGTQPDSVVVAPFRPAGSPYVVEASMQFVDGTGRFGIVLGRSGDGWYGAGVTPRGATISAYGTQAGDTDAPARGGTSPEDGIVVGGPVADRGWHTYRVEVTADSVRLLIDGAAVSEATGPVAGSGEVGLYAESTRVNVRRFSVKVAGRGATTAPSGSGSGGGGNAGGGSSAGSGGSAGGSFGTAAATDAGAATSGGTAAGGSTASGGTGGSASGGSTGQGASMAELQAGAGDGSANAGTGQPAPPASPAPPVPPAQPTTLRASAGAPGTILLSWVDNAHDASSLVVTIGWPDNLVVQWLAPGTTSLVFDRAEPQTTYRVTVAACNSNGCSARDETQVRTP